MFNFLRIIILFFGSHFCFSLYGSSSSDDKKVDEAVYNLHKLFRVYEVCVKEHDKEIGKMQFKVYKGPTVTCVIDYILPNGVDTKKENEELLLKIALKKINSLDCDVIETQIDADNKASRALFEKQGFKQTDAKPHMLGISIFLQKRM